MARLTDLQGNDMSWPELYRRLDAYYAMRAEAVAVQHRCQWGECVNVPVGRYCNKHRPQNRARLAVPA